MTIDEEIAALWEDQLNRLKHLDDLDARPEEDISEMIDDQAAKSDAVIRIAYPNSLRILEEGIHWLTVLHVGLHEALQTATEGSKTENRLRAPWALVGAGCAYAVAVRRLVLSGLDGPARVVLRSLAESLFVCIVLLDRDDLRDEYQTAGATGLEYEFWNRELRTAKLEGHLGRVESGLKTIDASVLESMSQWRKRQMQRLSGHVHLGYGQAVLTAMPPWDKMHFVGSLGAPSTGTAGTLTEATTALWYFATVGGYKLILSPDSPVSAVVGADYTERGWWNQIIVGREVFIQLVLNHWNDKEGPRFVPSEE